MKRLTFKSEFVIAVMDGTKTATFRFRYPYLRVGEIVAATTRTGKTPAHLVKASDGFCQLKIVSVTQRNWYGFTPDDYAKTHGTPIFYAAQPQLDGWGWFIEFERVNLDGLENGASD